MHFTDTFIRRPVLALVISLLILMVGLRAFFDLPLRQFPDVTTTTISVTTSYPGAPAELMQGFITTPVEQAIASVGGLDYVTSNSNPGVSTVTATLRLNYDPNVAMTDIMAKVQQVKYQLPREANDPIILKSVGEPLGVLIMTFASTNLSGSEVSDYVDRVVKPLIATVDGVAELTLFGAQKLAMRLWLDPDRMTARGVTAQEVAAAIRANNFQSAPGEAKGVYIVTRVTAETGLSDVNEFKQLVVRSTRGAQVHLGDVAEVELGGQNYRNGALLDGKPSVAASVQSAPGANPLAIVKGVRALEPELRRALPPGMEFGYGYDVSEFINAAIDEVILTLIEAVLIVIVVIYLFLGTLRSVIIPVVTIPLSLIGAGAVMLALGFSLNLLTLLALVLAIGLVVDDAIVVVENVYRHIEEGQSSLEAALNGAREIVGPVISMTITLAAVYAPIGFLSGLTGTLFREFAFTLAGAVIISGVIALTLSPMMASMLLKPHMHETGLAQRVEAIYVKVTAWYERQLTRVLDYRGAMAVFIAGIFAAVTYLYVHAPTELAPPEDRGAVLALIKGPQTANLDFSTAYAQKLTDVIGGFPEVRLSFTLTGMQGVNTAVNVYPLTPWGDRDRTATEVLQELQLEVNKLDGVAGFTFLPPPLPGAGGNLPVSMVMYSPGDYRGIHEAMDKLKTAARDSGLFIASDSDLTFNTPIVHINIDRAKTHDLGISMQDIGGTLSTLVGENYINRFNMEGRAYEVIAQVPRDRRLSAEALTQYYVRTPGGQQIPLSSLVSLSTTIQPNSLPRYNQLNSATFSAMPMPGVSMGQAVDFLRAQAETLPRGFATAFMSQSRQYVTEGSQMLFTFGFALIVIYLVLAAQFESLRDPLVILFSVPMSMCGALLPLFFGAGTLNIYTQVGLVTLIGLITKHGILMVAFARTMQIDHNADRRTAILEAARVRLRPILMTTAAMVAGLLPLVFASGAGAGARSALGLVVVMGMAIGTLFTLFVVPTVYTWIATDHRAHARAVAVPRPVPAE